MCARCSIISPSSAPTSWAIRWARASPPSSCVNHPARVRSAILGGLGVNLVDGHSTGLAQTIVAALEAPSLADVTHPVGRSFRSFAEQTKSDLKALAACMRRRRDPLSREQVAGIHVPVLVAVGTADEVAGSAA